MNTTLIGYRFLVLWQVLVAAGVITLSTMIGTWLIRFAARRKGDQPPSLVSTIAVSALVAIGAIISGALFLFSLWALPNVPELGLPGLVVIVGINAAAVWLMKKLPGLPGKRPALLLIIPSCGICGLVVFWFTMQHTFEYANRARNVTNLHEIGQGLIMYQQEHGTYPDDLRQLVDAGLDPVCLLAAYSKSGKEFAREEHKRPYRGPCDYSYTRLPAGAPGDLVWVWLAPEFFHDEWAFVLLKNGSASLITAEELSEMLAKTSSWMRDQPTTATARFQ